MRWIHNASFNNPGPGFVGEINLSKYSYTFLWYVTGLIRYKSTLNISILHKTNNLLPGHGKDLISIGRDEPEGIEVWREVPF